MRVSDTAVCTSGNYARFTTINRTRYSHIIDPRTGQPADAVPSVTVVANSAMAADIRATALSVSGIKGLPSLPDGFEAIMVEGTPDDHLVIVTPGMHDLLLEPFKSMVTVRDKNAALDRP